MRLAVIVLACLLAVACDRKPADPAPQADSCANDWKKCADNAQMARDYSGWADLRTACESAVEAQSPGGINVWSPTAFSHVNPGNIYVTSGVAVGVELDARLLQGITTGHAKIVCEYNLTTKQVTSLVQLPG